MLKYSITLLTTDNVLAYDIPTTQYTKFYKIVFKTLQIRQRRGSDLARKSLRQYQDPSKASPLGGDKPYPDSTFVYAIGISNKWRENI